MAPGWPASSGAKASSDRGGPTQPGRAAAIGKSDPLDAVEAARAASAAERGSPQGARPVQSKPSECSSSPSALLARPARRRSSRCATSVITAPDQLNRRLKGPEDPGAGGARQLPCDLRGRGIGHCRHQGLALLARPPGALSGRELAELDRRLEALVNAAAPELLALFGVGHDTAAALWSPPATTPNAFAQRPPGRICAVWHRSPRHQASPGPIRLTAAGSPRQQRTVAHRPGADRP